MEAVAPIAEIIADIKASGGQSARYCYQCGKCDVVCPWNRVRTFSIRKIVRQATLGLPEIELEDMWRCTTCGTCQAQCPRGVGQIPIGVALRRIAAQYGVLPEPARGVRTAAASLATDGNPLNGARDERDAWAKGLPVQPFREGMELLFYVGCYHSYDPRMRKVAVAIAEILDRAGVDFGILGTKESCCGESIRRTGNEERWKALAKQNIKTFVDAGVKKILVSSPHCYHTFKNEYPELMVRFEVVHVTELLSKLVDEGRLRLGTAVRRKVTFHDPCYLGRHNGIFDPPRDLLARVPGLELVEMPDNREKSLCCGGGGGRIWMDTPKGERFADLRLEQARQVGADVLVTSCPYCISNFEDGRLTLEGAPVVEDITEVIREAL
ncbi:MAG: (Fe-S)-binding protein [Deltaproteobacteria bacterium]|nr:(Fe-S)-binding protein [Deltaproteobacteria bacterium]